MYISGKRYVLLNEIGRGGSGVVFESLGPDRHLCAIKCVDMSKANAAVIANYTKELDMMLAIQGCDLIVRLLDQ